MPKALQSPRNCDSSGIFFFIRWIIQFSFSAIGLLKGVKFSEYGFCDILNTSFEKNDFFSAKLDMFRIMIINILYLETKFEIIYVTAGPSDRVNYLNFL